MANGMLLRGFFVSSPRVAAASNPMNDRMPKTTPSPTPAKPVGAAEVRNDPEDEEHDHLDDQKSEVDVHRCLDTAHGKAEHDGHRDQAEDPPLEVRTERCEHVVMNECSEGREEAGGEDRVPDPEQPSREEAGCRAEAGAVEGVEGPGGRQLSCELHDGIADEGTGEEGDEE
jgi:hypothetical protein